jgi:hypothetical protein
MRKEKLLLAFTVCVLVASCKKGADDELLSKNTKDNNLHTSVSRLSYGENFFYIKDNNSLNKVSPVSRPSFIGHFTSIPSGLALDRNTGAIDLSNSQPGQPYKIFYIDNNGYLADSVRIVISGLDYVDGIYDSEDNKPNFGKKSTAINGGDQSKPITSSFFNSFLVSYQPSMDDSEDNTGLSINKKDGSIDLKKSKTNGLFGRKPENGAYKELVIKYRLADKSARKLNIMKIKLFFFSNESNIPQSIRRIIEERKIIMERVNAMPLPGNTSTTTTGILTEESLDAYAKPVRPPLIVVT